MAFEIVDGMTGTKHISSDDLAALNTATVGKANCVLEYGNDFALTMTSANAATLGTGVGMVGGKRFWNQAAASLTIQSGTQGQKRNDLVVARYAKTSAGIESINPVVIKGTPTAGNPADPNTTANDLKLWRIPLNGINAGTPVRLFKPVTPLATLGDSVSRAFEKSEHQYMYGTNVDNDFVFYRRVGIFVEMFWNFSQSTTTKWKAGTLPTGYRPNSGFMEPSVLVSSSYVLSNNTANVEVRAEGDVTFSCAEAVSGARNIGHSIWIAA